MAVSTTSLVNDETLEQAYEWISKQRLQCSPNNSIWALKPIWAKEKKKILDLCLAGQYPLSPLQCYFINKQWVSSWDAKDAVLLKAISLGLQPYINHDTQPQCTHLKKGGGIHGAITKVSQFIPETEHILKSDIHHYYESMNHQRIIELMGTITNCPIVLDLIRQYCQRVEIRYGYYYSFDKGIPKGCSLSPLIAALNLKPLDEAMSRMGQYVRYMDDWVVMVKTKHQLRRVIKRTHQILKQLNVKMHPDKTFVGRIKNGFDFLGIHFSDTPCLSKKNYDNHKTQIARRYAPKTSLARLWSYREKWLTWAQSVLKACRVNNHNNKTSTCFAHDNILKRNYYETYQINRA